MTKLQKTAAEVSAYHKLSLAAQSRIDAVVSAAEEGTSASLILAGPPATGKSTLVRAIHDTATRGMSSTRLLVIEHYDASEGWQAVIFSKIYHARSTNLAQNHDAMHLRGFFHGIGSDDLMKLLHDDQVVVTWKWPYTSYISLAQEIDGVAYDQKNGLTAVVRLPRIRTLIDRTGEVSFGSNHTGAVFLTRRLVS